MKGKDGFRFYYVLAVGLSALVIVLFARFGVVSGNFSNFRSSLSLEKEDVARETVSVAFADVSGRVRFFDCEVEMRSGNIMRDTLAFLFNPGKEKPDDAMSYINPDCSFSGCTVEDNHIYILVSDNFFSGMSESETRVAERQIKGTVRALMPEMRRYTLIVNGAEHDFTDV